MPKSPSLSDLSKLYGDHFSVLKIKEKHKIQSKFQFREISPDEIRKIIQFLNKKKSAISSCIPVKHLIESADITSEPSLSSSRRVSSFKDSSALMNDWEANSTKVKYFQPLVHCLRWKPKIYIRTQAKCTKRWNQSSAIKQLLETLFRAIKMCTGFTTDGIYMNKICNVTSEPPQSSK